ncbi:unnamed protein product [Callosobruchus maculatus]|uniref:Transketolase N-terminal domain-containing protein n=1 Tax=Callosobruchus maculatus TaxID=64391 RepID=A0A653CB85_CALMS|nr:unnamed protein product [Callosobruchus maculatus]
MITFRATKLLHASSLIQSLLLKQRIAPCCNMPTDVQTLKEIATRIRILSVESTSAANSGHPTTCSSIAEILSVLFFNTMRYKVSEPRDPGSDRLVLSKGHAAPALYACWMENGLIPHSENKNVRKLGSNLEGHPTPRLNFVDVGTGSLGQGLAIANGMATLANTWTMLTSERSV